MTRRLHLVLCALATVFALLALSVPPASQLVRAVPIARSHLATACLNLDCPTSTIAPSDHHGPLVTNPVVYLVRLSSSKTTLTPNYGFVPNTFSSSEPNAAGAVRTILSSAYEGWWASEYSRPAAGQFINPGTYAGTITLYAPALATAPVLSDNQIAQYLATAGLPVTPNAVFVLFLRLGQVVTIDTQTSSQDFCGYHSSVTTHTSTLAYVVLPNEMNNVACQGYGTTPFDQMTPLLSHEVAEAITDPASPFAWITSSNQEVGDLCDEGATTYAPVSDGAYSYQLAYLYSSTTQACFASSVPTRLAIYQPTSTMLVATLQMNAYGSVPASSLRLFSAGTLLATATTDQNGQATFTLPTPLPATPLTISYAGSGPLDAVTTNFVTSAAGPTSTTYALEVISPTYPESAPDVITYVTPVATPVSVTVTAPNLPSQGATTDLNGSAAFTLSSAVNRTMTYTASAALPTATGLVNLSVDLSLVNPARPSLVHRGQSLWLGSTLVSPNGRYAAGVTTGGRFEVQSTATGQPVYVAPATGVLRLALSATGRFALLGAGGRLRWQAPRMGANSVAVTNTGTLVAYQNTTPLWSSR